MPCCIWGTLGTQGSRTLQFYSHLKAFEGGRYFEFLKSLVPHSLFLVVVCVRFV